MHDAVVFFGSDCSTRAKRGMLAGKIERQRCERVSSALDKMCLVASLHVEAATSDDHSLCS